MEQEGKAHHLTSEVTLAIVNVLGPSSGAERSTEDSVAESLEGQGHKVVRRVSIQGEPHDVQKALREAIEDKEVQAIVLVGGTGLSRPDITMDAVEPFEEKPIPGFGEALRSLSADMLGPGSMLIRCRAFVSESKVVFCLPASERVARLAADRLIGPTLKAAVREAAG